MRTASSIALLLGLLAQTALTATAQGPGLALAPESRLWIAGTSTINSFVCEAGHLEGEGALGHPPDARLYIDVATFDCGKQAINRDFQAALQASYHPTIDYRLHAVEVMSEPTGPEAAYRLRAQGRLTIAGVMRDIETTAQGWLLPDGRVRLAGAQVLRLTDFDIAPPTALMGLIRVRNTIVVDFDLIAVLARAPPWHTHEDDVPPLGPGRAGRAPSIP